MTPFEDAIEREATPAEIDRAETEARQRFQEIVVLIDKLRVIKSTPEAPASN